MPKLPDYTAIADVGLRAPQFKTDLPAANDVGTAIGGLGRAVSGLSAKLESDAGDAEKFDTQRRFIEFQGNWDRYATEQMQNAPVGAAGITDRLRTEYDAKAREFFSTVPNKLKPEYDRNLFNLEDRLATRANDFEVKAQFEKSKAQVADGLNILAVRIGAVADPTGVQKTLGDVQREGEDYINAAPGVPPSVRASLIKTWRTQAQTAAAARIAELDPENARSLLGIGTGGGVNQRALIASAQRLGMEPSDLAKIVSYETAGTFDPDKRGGMNKDGTGAGSFLGLIQFSPENQRKYGVKPGMTFEQQIGAVEAYMTDRGWKPGMSLAHAYSIINAGSLDENGDPRWDRADVNGNLRQHVARIDREHAAAAERFLSGAMPSDPRFADVPYDTRLRIVDAAERKIAQAHVQIEAQQVQGYERQFIEASAGKGPLPARSTIENDAVLSESRRNALLKQYDAAVGDVAAFQQALTKFKDQNGGGYNPFDTDEAKQVDKIYKMLGANQAALQEVVDRTKTVPESAMRGFRGDIASSDPARVANALDITTGLLARSPTIFTGEQGEKQVEKATIAYQHYVNDLGYTRAQAAQKIIEANSPEYQAKLKARLKTEDVDAVIKKAVQVGDFHADLKSAFNEGLPLFSRPELEANPKARQLVIANYAELVKEKYLKGGDMALARTQAKRQMREIWGVSYVNGEMGGVFMRLAPERAPALAGIPDAADQFAAQVIAGIKQETGQEVERKKIMLAPVPHGQTAQAYFAGQPPPYTVSYFDRNGVVQTIQKPFVPDVAAMRSARDEQARTSLMKQNADMRARVGFRERLADRMRNPQADDPNALEDPAARAVLPPPAEVP